MQKLVVMVRMMDTFSNCQRISIVDGTVDDVIDTIQSVLKAEGFSIDQWMDYKGLKAFDAVSSTQMLRFNVNYCPVEEPMAFVKNVVDYDVV